MTTKKLFQLAAHFEQKLVKKAQDRQAQANKLAVDARNLLGQAFQVAKAEGGMYQGEFAQFAGAWAPFVSLYNDSIKTMSAGVTPANIATIIEKVNNMKGHMKPFMGQGISNKEVLAKVLGFLDAAIAKLNEAKTALLG